MPRRQFGICSRCGQQRRIAVASKGWCSACYWDVSPKVVCGGCGRRRRRTAVHQGAELCRECWRGRRPAEACQGCGLGKPIVSRRNGAALCATCWVRVRPPETCGSCGRPTRQPRRDGAGGTLCPRCFESRRPPEVCGGCGRLMRVHGRDVDGSALCSRCKSKARPPEPCVRCGRVAAVVARRVDGPRCEGCWVYERTGRRCGCAAPVLVDRVCVLCAVGREGRAGLAAAVRGWLVTGGPRARRSLRATAAGRLLLAMLKGELAADHAALDTAGPAAAVAVLRARLVDLGVLKPREEALATVERAVLSAVERAHPDDAPVLARFGRWAVLHGVAVRIDRGTVRLGTPRAATARMRRVALLLAELRGDDLSLAQLEQPWLDEWVGAHPGARPDARAFLRWARGQGIVTTAVDVDPAASADVRAEIDEDERHGLLACILHDEAIAARDRVAGFLLAGLGQALTRIAVLTVDDVRPGEPTRLLLGATPLSLPPPLDRLVCELAAAAVARSGRWLFPGQSGHISPERLSERMAALGIADALAARNAAWAALAADTPAVVLSEKLGISASAADRWAQAVAAGRSRYAALLDEG